MKPSTGKGLVTSGNGSNSSHTHRRDAEDGEIRQRIISFLYAPLCALRVCGGEFLSENPYSDFKLTHYLTSDSGVIVCVCSEWFFGP
jgi:hypothetical protein